MNYEFNRHRSLGCNFTIEFNVKNPKIPELDYGLLLFEYETGEFTNQYADKCFKEIMRSGYGWLQDWSFAGRMNGWFALLCGGDTSVVQTKSLERIEAIVEKYFNKYAEEMVKFYKDYEI